MLAVVIELDAGAGDEIPHSLRDQHLTRRRRCRPACGDVHRNAAELVADSLALGGVDAGTYVEPEQRRRVLDRAGAADRARGAVERRHEPVAGRVDLDAAEALKLTPDRLVVPLEQLAPAAVAECDGSLGRSDDVGEENRGEDAIGVRYGTHACEELLDLVDDRIGLADDRTAILSR